MRSRYRFVALAFILFGLGSVGWWRLFVFSHGTAGSPVPIERGYTGFSRNPTRPIIAHNGELWDIEKQQKIRDFEPAYSDAIWSSDGRYLATVTTSGAEIYDIDTQQLIRLIEWQGETTELRLWSAVWSADGSLLVIQAIEMAYDKTGYRYASNNNIIALYRMPEGKLIQQWRTTTEPISYLAVSPDGALVVLSFNCVGEVWSVEENRRISKLSISLCHSQPVFSHDGELLAGTNSNDILLYDTNTWQLRSTFRGHTGAINALEFSSDDKMLVSGAGIEWSSGDEPPTDTTARVWDVTDGQLLTVFEGHHAPVTDVTFLEGRQMVVSIGNDNNLRFWPVLNLENGTNQITPDSPV